jgi:hypothetical protein
MARIPNVLPDHAILLGGSTSSSRETIFLPSAFHSNAVPALTGPSTRIFETLLFQAGHFSKSLPVEWSESWRQFIKAIQYAGNAYNQEVLPALRIKKAGYQLIDIAKYRRAGINAIPRPGK